MTSISKLNDDCLQVILEACDGCPWTLCTVSQVCRQWYTISHRPSVWQKLVINRPYSHAAYTRFLTSQYNFGRLQAIKTLVISKPIESRHAHLRSLPFKSMPHITHIYSSNLCLAEIEFLSHQILETKSKLNTLVCTNVETWCDTRRFSMDMIQVHTHLRKAEFKFSQDGHSGFASIHNKSSLENAFTSNITHFALTSVRDDETIEQRNILIVLEEIENDRDEVYYPQDIEQIENRKNVLLDSWRQLERALIDKYHFFLSLRNLERLEFGFCYAWTPDIWRNSFGKVILASPHLTHLGLHGWDQLGKLEKVGSQSSTIQPIRADAEQAIAECFESMLHLTCLQLIDFSVGPGLFKGGQFISKSIQHLDIVFTRVFLRYFSEPADTWLLIGPLKELILAVFSFHSNEKRTLTIRMHPDLIDEVQRNSFFVEEPFLESIKSSLQDKNVKIELLEYYLE